jgi:hypothetical protein
MRLVVVLAVAACSTPPAREPRSRAPDPTVDQTCVAHARAGTLADLIPAEAAGFTITQGKDAIVLARTGQVMTTDASRKAWQVLGEQVFMRGGLSSGDAATGSIYKCEGVADESCFHFTVWICQLPITELARRVADALDQHGYAGTEVVVHVKLEEQRGPSCKNGATCLPAQHYSTHGHYDPHGGRDSLDDGTGTCRDDGDCEGANSDSCRAWYLSGGAEATVFIQRRDPTFCGCIAQRCTWFTQ